MSGVRTLLRRRALPLAVTAALALLGATAAAVPSASGAYSARIANSTGTAGTAANFVCAPALAQDAGTALFQWPLADAAGSTTAADISGGGRTGTYVGTMATSASTPVACPRDGGTAWDLDGTSSAAYYSIQQNNPQVFTVEIWFRTTVAGGKLIGYGRSATGANGTYDRHLFLTATGAVAFGVYNGGAKVVLSPRGGYNDGAWHQAAGTLSASGMTLYVDGAAVGTNPNTAAEVGTGYWRVGYDSISTSWTSPAVSGYFKGRLRYAAVYTSALTAQQIGAHWGAGSGT